jgi:hypothetical protein
MGKIITPGENHHTDTCTAATAMAAVARHSANAIRRFLVMNWLRSSDWNLRRARCRRGGAETMMGELYSMWPQGS